MPYRLPKELESESNNQWMEECIAGVLSRAKNIDEAGATNVCRRRLVEKKGDQARANIAVINDILELYSEDRRAK